MEEEILKIIEDKFCKSDGSHYLNAGKENGSSAKEIAETFERYDYWKAYNTVRHKGQFQNLKDQFEVVDGNKWFTGNDELFTYWNTNIKDK